MPPGPAVRGGGRARARAAPGLRSRAGLPGADVARPGRRRGRSWSAPAARASTSCRCSSAPAATCGSDLPPLVAAAARRAPRRALGAARGVGEHAEVIEAHGRARRHAARDADIDRPLRSQRHEPAPVPFRPGGRAPQPEPHRDRQGAVHLAARHQQGHHRARGRARRRDLRAPRQAPAPHHRAGPAGAEVDRGDHARGRPTSSASARSSPSRTPARCRSPPRTRRRATSCPGRWPRCASVIPRCRWCCTRARRSRWRACCTTTSPRSAWPPSRWPTSTNWSRCLATSGSTWWWCLPAIRWPQVERPTLEQLAPQPLVTYHPRSPAARASTPRSRTRG